MAEIKRITNKKERKLYRNILHTNIIVTEVFDELPEVSRDKEEV